MKSISDYYFGDAKAGLLHGFFRKCADDFIPASRYPKVLDIGCGNGSLCRYLKDNQRDVIGIEPGPKGYEIARLAHPDIKFYHTGIEDPIPSDLHQVDTVICTEVVEHLFLPRNLPHYINRVLRPGGRAVITTPYHGWLKNCLISATGKWDSHHSPLWDYGHVKFWSPKTLALLFEEKGFTLVDFRGYGRLPYLWKTMALVFDKPF